MGFYFFTIPTLVIANPELMKQVLVKDFSHFTDREFYFDKNDPLTNNMSTSKGNEWRKVRVQLSPAFSPSKLNFDCWSLLKVCEHLKLALDKSAENVEVVDLKDVVSKYVVDAIGSNVFGIECKTLQDSNMEFKKFAEGVLGGGFIKHIKVMLSILCPAVLYFFKISLHSGEIQKFYFDLVRSVVEYRENNNVVRNDLMHSMIQLRNNINLKERTNLNIDKNVSENEKSSKIKEITANILLFFGAAYETTSSAISLCIYELASNEDVQVKLRNEIMSVLENNEGKIDYDAIMEMTYLHNCIFETLRKHAVVGMTSRTCSKKYQFPNTNIVVDVGTILYLPIYEFQQDQEYFPNPEKFDPERFSHNNISMRPDCTFLSFGKGQRNCIGSRLALVQIKLFLATFLTNYNFSINSKFKLPPTFSNSNMIVSFENPLYLNIEKI